MKNLLSESQALDEMIRQATLSAQLDDGLVLPWEQGVMASIFGDEPLSLDENLPKIRHSINQSEDSSQRILDQVLEPVAKRTKLVSATTRMYERAIRFRLTLSDMDADEFQVEQGLGETLCSHGFHRLEEFPRVFKSNLDIWTSTSNRIRILCGSRSPNPVSKRANSL